MASKNETMCLQFEGLEGLVLVEEISSSVKDTHWTLNILLQRRVHASNPQNGTLDIRNGGISTLPPSSAETFLRERMELSNSVGITFVFSQTGGQVVRSDILERRLEGCQVVAKSATFLEPLAVVKPIPVPTSPPAGSANQLIPLLQHAIGGIELKDENHHMSSKAFRELDKVLEDRLAFPFLLPSDEAVSRRRVAWIQGREDFTSSRRAYEAALALGITLVVFDEQGHWLQDDDFAYLREAFVPLNIDPDPGFADRIVTAVSSYPEPFDGIVTISDVRLPAVAKACEILKLPTSPFSAYLIAGDKAQTRLLEPGSEKSFILQSAEELPEYLEQHQNPPLEYPLIVKPCIGWNSDCVAKVSNEEELTLAVDRASRRHAEAAKRSTAVVVEPYIDGPEVDANLVLLNGEVIFYDINDDFPSRGDAVNANYRDNFQETQNVIPSALPEHEKIVIRDSLRQSILRQGFSSGVFHCEARLRYSSVHYTLQEGIVDLEAKIKPEPQDVDVYLLEVNARPPGYLETVAVLLGYGVDYYALRLLLSIGDSENQRLRALSQPFISGAQFHLSFMIVQQTKAGIMKTPDAGAEFLAHHPELEKRILDYKTQKKGGEVLEGPAASSLWWIAYFSVISRDSRRDLLETVDYIEKNFNYEIDEVEH